jgi:23S rRNA U2552 (ribose-2'-O)-methylase RlmE/FtsJ
VPVARQDRTWRPTQSCGGLEALSCSQFLFNAYRSVLSQVWADPYADKLYEIKRERLRQSSMNRNQSKIFEVYGDVVNELTAAFTNIGLLGNGITGKSTTCEGALNTATTSRVNVLDICMAPGGFAKVILDGYKNTYVYGLSLPPSQGGHYLIESEFIGGLQDRFEIQYLDITMLAAELSTDTLSIYPEHSKFSTKRPYSDIKFDLIIADGAVLESHERSQYRTKIVEGVRLRASELVLALQRIKNGGTFVMLLHHINVWETVQILHDFMSFATVQVKKPTTSHKASSSFYIIAEEVRPTCAAAAAFVAKWKNTWREATFEPVSDVELPRDEMDAIESTLASLDIHSAKATDGEVYGLLKTFGPTLIEMGRPVWEAQIEGLHGKKGRKAYSGRPEQSRRSTNESAWGREEHRGSVNRGNFAGPGHQDFHPKAQRRGSLRSDDSTTAASWHSSNSERSQAIRGNWNMKKESDLAREMQAKKERQDARRASAAKIQDIWGKSSWRSGGMRDENQVGTAGPLERAGNARARE